jgi:hypothetical protein
MLRLPESLRAWQSPEFAAVLQRELAAQSAGELPLQRGMAGGSHALDEFSVMVIGAAEDGDCILARVGVFFSGVIAGCNCADDPTPVEPQHEYCELRLAIDRRTATVAVTLLD